MSKYAGLALLALAAAPACEWGPQVCEGEWAAMPEAQNVSTTQSRIVAQVQPVESTAVDILFVIDDSRSMTDEQFQLGVWSSEMFDVLSSSGELPDLHIGVVSSSVAIPELPGCETGGGGNFHVGTAVLKDGKFIRDVAGPEGRVRNYDGTLTDTFAKMAKVGDGGCGFEQPFKAARLALAGNTTSPGFLREDALLLVVFVTDEDDCSASSSALFATEATYSDTCSELGPSTSYRCFEHGVRCADGKGSRAFGERKHCSPNEDSYYVESVEAFADSLKRLKQDPGQVIVAGIYGKPNGIVAIQDERFTSYKTPRLASVCRERGVEGTGATPAVRMNALMAQFGGRASQSSICEEELSWAMHDVGLVTRDVAMRSHCLRGPLVDIDPVAAGTQPSCRVAAISGAARVEVPRCENADETGCFTLVADAECAETETHMAFRVRNSAEKGTMTVSCIVDEDGAGIPVRDSHASE